MAETGIYSECCRTAEQRIADCRLHPFRGLVISRFKIRVDFKIRDSGQTSTTEYGICQKRADFCQRQPVCGKNKKRVSRKFFSSGAACLKRPPLFQNCGDLSNLHERLLSAGLLQEIPA